MTHARRTLPLCLLLGGLALAAAHAVPACADPGRKKDPHLEYRRTYADALLESKVRNLPVFVSRHKDD